MDKARGEFTRFIVTGSISTAFNFSIFYCLILGAVHYLIASGAGYICGLLLGYKLNNIWTFKIDEKLLFRKTLVYFLVYSMSLILSLFTLNLLTSVSDVDVRIANIFVIGISTLTNFIGIKLLVYSK